MKTNKQVNYKYTFEIQDTNTNDIVIVYENTERRAFREASKLFNKKRLMDREMKIISKKNIKR